MSHELLTFSISVFTGFFAIMNPIGNAPIFLGMTEGFSDREKKKIAKISTLTAFLIVTSFIVMGNLIFMAFGITIPAFKIAGGILVFYVGFEMLQSKKSTIHRQRKPEGDKDTADENESNTDIAVTPLAIPILAGPGTIVTAMNYITKGDYIRTGIVIAIFALMIVLTYLAFIGSEKIIEKVGKGLIAVISKLMGLILTVIGVGMLVDGIKLSFGV
ncbi:MAG: NAAT family transporter [Chlorobi bacterium]|nr:NAAT family transporter [Chlorobiota bacterium]